MCYSTKSIQDARSQQLQQQQELEKNNQLEKNDKINNILKLNKFCEVKLPNGVAAATLADFGRSPSGPLDPELDAFVHCRVFTGPTRPRNAQWEGEKFKTTNKGKLNEAQRGKDNNISRAFKVKDRPIVLVQPSTELAAVPDGDVVVVGPTVLPTLGVVNIDIEQASIEYFIHSKERNEAVKGEIVGADFTELMKADTIIQAEQLLLHLDKRTKTLLASRLP